jgi:hypothetical protein
MHHDGVYELWMSAAFKQFLVHTISSGTELTSKDPAGIQQGPAFTGPRPAENYCHNSTVGLSRV